MSPSTPIPNITPKIVNPTMMFIICPFYYRDTYYHIKKDHTAQNISSLDKKEYSLYNINKNIKRDYVHKRY